MAARLSAVQADISGLAVEAIVSGANRIQGSARFCTGAWRNFARHLLLLQPHGSGPLQRADREATDRVDSVRHKAMKEHKEGSRGDAETRRQEKFTMRL